MTEVNLVKNVGT